MSLEKQTEELVKLLEKYQDILVKEEQNINKQKRYLIEMARDKNYVIGLFDSKKAQIIMHLICCYFWTSSYYYTHWKEDIFSFLFELPKLKQTKKYPTRKNLEIWFMEEIKENLDDKLDTYIQNAYEKEGCNFDIPEHNKQNLYNFIYSYFSWLCDNICDGKVITKSGTAKEIDNLIKQYK